MDKNTSQLLVIDGGVVKTSADGIVEGMGIVFGSETEPDQSSYRDFFTSESFIQKKSKFNVPLFYNHGLGLYDEQIGEATLTKDEDGWKAVGEIDCSTELGEKVYNAVKESPHGFSTGALQHLVQREAKSNKTNFLKRWVVGELSLTERPAERRAVVQAVKSIDGSAVYTDAFEEDKQNTITVALYDACGNKVWDVEDGTPLPAEEITKSAKTIEIKDVNGSISYTVSMYDEDSDQGTTVSVYQYGGVADLVAHLQEVVAAAALAIAEDVAEDAQDAADDAAAASDFETRVTAIVQNIMTANEVDDTAAGSGKTLDLETALKNAENEIADLTTKLSDREDALTIANERNAQLEILAGATETINKYKGK